MFWERFFDLCAQKGLKPNPVCSALGFSSATATKWKSGSIPNGDALLKIAQYFNCSVDYLLGRDEKNPPAPEGGGIWEAICADETKLILATWIAELDGDDLAKVSSVLAAILEKRNPQAPQG